MKKKKLIIDRTFNAPIDKVWAAFTNPEILAKWWSPAGMMNYHTSTDVREGGEFRYCFESSVYQTINEPTYLSYIDNFTDSDGTPVPPAHYGIPGDVPVPTLVEFVFTAKGDKTDMRITGENPYDDSMTENMTQGWNSMFDKLVDRLN